MKKAHPPLLIRDVMLDNRSCDVMITDGKIHAIGKFSHDGDMRQVAGRGGRLLPGLIDHHIHLFACAAHRHSLDVGPQAVSGLAALTHAVQKAARAGPVRATGYHESVAGPLDRHMLDRICATVPVRVQYRTGSLWVMNSAALDGVMSADTCRHDGIERDRHGDPTGRIWRGDKHLRVSGVIPDLAPLSRDLARWGVTGISDTSPDNDASQAVHFAAAVRSGQLRQKLMLLGRPGLGQRPEFLVGPVKIQIDDHDLPDFDAFTATIRAARKERRSVAVHCVTAAELAFALAGFREAGAMPGDRIEHGAIIDDSVIPEIRDLGLTIVTQPAMIAERGDEYIRDVPGDEQNQLYRCGSLIAAGIKVAAGSDAPYTSPNPWPAIRAAHRRMSPYGHVIGAAERLDPETALTLYFGDFSDPGGPQRQIRVGAAADLCLLPPGFDLLRDEAVAATIIDGDVVYRNES